MLLHEYVDRWAAQRPDGEFAVQGERRTTWAQARDVEQHVLDRVAGQHRAAVARGEPGHP